MDPEYGPAICDILAEMASNGTTVILAFEDQIYNRKDQRNTKENIGQENVRITSDRILGSKKHLWNYWYEMSREFLYRPEKTLYITSDWDSMVYPDSIGIDCLYETSPYTIAAHLKI